MTRSAVTHVSLSDAALRLGVTYWRARDLLLTGILKGGRDGRRFLVDAEHLEQVVEERRRTETEAGRR